MDLRAAHLLLEPGGGCLSGSTRFRRGSWPPRFPAGLPIEVGATNPSDRGGRRQVRIEWSDMRLHLDDPSVAGALVAYLNARPDCVAAETGRGVVEVNILGSQRLPFMRLELDLRLGAWRAANPGVGVILVTG